MNDNNIGIKFHKEIDEIELKNMESNYEDEKQRIF